MGNENDHFKEGIWSQPIREGRFFTWFAKSKKFTPGTGNKLEERLTYVH
jgi:hypothetical protein